MVPNRATHHSENHKNKFSWQSAERLTHFSPMFYFYTPRNHQKTFCVMMFSGGIEVEHWADIG